MRQTRGMAVVGVCVAFGWLAGSCGGGGGGGGGGSLTLTDLQTPGTQAAAAPYDVPSTVLLGKLAAETFTVRGTGFGSAGDTCQVTFTDPANAATFDASGGPTVTVPAAVADDQSMTGTMPILSGANRLSADVLTDVRVTRADGVTGSVAGLVRLVAPPTIHTLVNLRATFQPSSPGTLLPTNFLSLLSTPVRLTGTNFDTAPGPNPAFELLVYDSALGPSQPIGAGTLAAVVVTPTQVTGSSPTDATRNVSTACRLRVRNRDDQFDLANLTYDVTGVVANRNVISAVGSNSGTSIAVNPTNPQNVVVVGSDLSGTPPPVIRVATTLDGGVTWTSAVVGPVGSAGDDILPPTPVPPATSPVVLFRQDPQVVADAGGVFYLAYRVRYDLAPWPAPAAVFDGVPVLMSTDGGLTWNLLPFPPLPGSNGLQTALNTSALPGATPSSYQVRQFHLSVGPDGATTGNHALHVVGSIVSPPAGLTEWHCIEGASVPPPPALIATWWPLVWFNAATIGQLGDVSAAVGPAGEVYVFAVGPVAAPGVSSLVVNVDVDGLAGPGGFVPALGAGGTPVAPSGTPWLPVVIPPQPDLGTNCSMSPAVIPTGPHAGRVVVAYVDTPLPPAAPHIDVRVAISDTQGATWTPSIPVHAPSPVDQFNPALAVDPVSGRVYVSWYDAKDDLSGVWSQVNRYSASSADGLTWTSGPLLLSQGRSDESGGGDPDDYRFVNGLAAHARLVWASWGDSSDSTGDNAAGGGWEGQTEVYVSPYQQKP